MVHEPPILVTGAAGFVGAAVCARLVGAGRRVLGLDDLSAGDRRRVAGLEGAGLDLVIGDVRDRALVDGLLAEGPSAVLHLAARVGVRRVLGDPLACELENLEGARVLAEAVAAAPRTPRVVAASTSEVYAESAAPLVEGAPLRPRQAEGRWRYAASKRVAEETFDGLCPAARTVHLRFFNVVGPGQDAASGMVLPRFVEAARGGAPLEVYGSGAQVRTFAHVDAVARDVAALVAPESFPVDRAALDAFAGALNVGGTARTTIAALAALVARLAGGGSPILRRDPRRVVAANFEEVRVRVPDLGRARALGLGAAGLGSEPWGLEALVADTLARHVPPRVQEAPCASRAS